VGLDTGELAHVRLPPPVLERDDDGEVAARRQARQDPYLLQAEATGEASVIIT